MQKSQSYHTRRPSKKQRHFHRKHFPDDPDSGSRMKPAIDPTLKKIFAKIGKPFPSPLVPDYFQLKALDIIKKTDCLVTAPTGTGKTWIAEKAITHFLKKGGRSWYASPLKALSNSKWIEFSEIYGRDNVGILTGDTKENPDAPIIVGTTEILRNQLYDAMHQGHDLSCELVILDEAHFLGDKDRGVVWEEIMIYLPTRINLLLLSATIGNDTEIAQWLEAIRKKQCVVVSEDKRPVPLYPLFLEPTGRLMPLITKKKLYGKVASFINKNLSLSERKKQVPPFDDIITVLRKYNLLPALFFLSSRQECNTAINACTTKSKHQNPDTFNRDINLLLDRFSYLEEHPQLPMLRDSRVAAHHAGQLPAWKITIETMMKSGHLDAVFATSTVAAGVNFPARTVVLMNSDKFNGREFLPLDPTTFHQMTGRAGRRGQDEIGFLMIYPRKYMDIGHIKDLIYQKPGKIFSQIRNDFSMILNLLLSYTPEEISDIFALSLSGFQHTKKEKKKRLRLWEDFNRHLDFLKKEGFVTDSNRLTDDGVWASQLRLDQPLLIAECLRKHAFPEDNPALLAAAVAPFVYDREQNIDIFKRKISNELKKTYITVTETVMPLAKRMRQAGFTVNPLPFWASFLIYEWGIGTDWNEITRSTRIADGDLTMLITRTADNLNQLTSLKKTHTIIAALAHEARSILLRNPVIFE